ncbi:MAG: protein translocase subunit SecF [Gammaproteobacteria bacterium]|nr:protein translocase subunit SecF [Gammaproteobacteria bacterium]MCP5298831.1 protein translocase subunit SecF [Chromatiaceae bacterium]
MQIISNSLRIDYMRFKNAAVGLSVAWLLVAAAAIAIRGLNFGIDFTGGTLIEVGYQNDVQLESVRGALQGAGFGSAAVQRFGTLRDVLIRLPVATDAAEGDNTRVSNEVFAALSKAADGKVELRRVEFVGPQVGDELAEDGALAVLVALIAILMYVAMRFEWRFAVGAVVALAHDVLFTVGLFALLQIEFDLPVLAAVLAVIGYSLNDTIVIFDRVRENFRKMRKGTPDEIVNISVNQTMSRTIMTSGTTLIVLLALFFLGGENVHGFSLALIVGVVVGTYSTIYVASAVALWLGVSKADLMPVKKEGLVDDRP